MEEAWESGRGARWGASGGWCGSRWTRGAPLCHHRIATPRIHSKAVPRTASKRRCAGYALPHDENVGAVIVGFDREINYHKIQYAQLCINENEGCEFIATNLDAVTHLTDAQEWAGNGAMTGAIKGCTGKEPTLVGKPSPLMIDYIVEKYGCDRDRICMVGDRLDTDILFGQNNGLLSCLTLSGVTTEAKLLSDENQIKPDYYVGSIAEFM